MAGACDAERGQAGAGNVGKEEEEAVAVKAELLAARRPSCGSTGSEKRRRDGSSVDAASSSADAATSSQAEPDDSDVENEGDEANGAKPATADELEAGRSRKAKQARTSATFARRASSPAARRCRVFRCQAPAKAGGSMCEPHTIRPQTCVTTGCQALAKVGGLCMAHGGVHQCFSRNCILPATNLTGLCEKHTIAPAPSQCAVPLCALRCNSSGFCKDHRSLRAAHSRRYSPATRLPPPPPPLAPRSRPQWRCHVGGCLDFAAEDGLCLSHVRERRLSFASVDGSRIPALRHERHHHHQQHQHHHHQQQQLRAHGFGLGLAPQHEPLLQGLLSVTSDCIVPGCAAKCAPGQQLCMGHALRLRAAVVARPPPSVTGQSLAARQRELLLLLLRQQQQQQQHQQQSMAPEVTAAQMLQVLAAHSNLSR